MEPATAHVQSVLAPSSEKVVEVSASIYTHKRIDFHLARKNYDISTANNGFHLETLNSDSWRKRPIADTGMEISPAGKRVSDGFGETIADPELTFASRICKIGAGLENIGNTCYLNSVLQCLTYTEPLAAYLQSGKHQSSCNIAGFCALCAIQKHVIRALESSGRSLVPKDLISNLRCILYVVHCLKTFAPIFHPLTTFLAICRNFRSSRQEDAHEYMISLLESMHKCCLPSGISCESPAAYEKSLVHKIFGGRLRSQVECQQCFHRSEKFDPFLDISLEITKAESLPIALKNFTTSEILDGGEKHYQCLQCKDKVKAKKRLTIHNPPHVLTIHLKRFHAYDPGRKVDRRVYFGPCLDVKPFSSFSNELDSKYILYGVLVHLGHNTHSGHYVCFVRTSSGIWYLLNDREVRAVSEKSVLEQKAYMLFYVRDRRTVSRPKSANLLKKDTNAVQNGIIQLSKELKNNVLFELKAKNIFRFESSKPSEISAATYPIKIPYLPLSSARYLPANPINSIADMSLPSSTIANMSLLKDVDEKKLQTRVDYPKGQENGHEATKSVSPITDQTPSLPSKSENIFDPERITVGDCTTASLASVSGDVVSVSDRFSRRKSYSYVRGGLRSFFLQMGIRKRNKLKNLKCKTERLRKAASSDSKGLKKLNGEMIMDGIDVMKSDINAKEVADSDRKDNEASICDAIPMSIETEKETSRTLMTTKVKRWDDSEDSPLFLTNGFYQQKKSIGYVPDEWDEEYDRGKRKKVRERNVVINGFNPFQMMANHKSKNRKFR